MKIAMVLNDVQDFGGLEEYATNLACGLHEQGHKACILSFARVSPQNQYARKLRESGIPLFQAPAWLSKSASDWQTKEAILGGALWCLGPLILIAGMGLSIFKGRPLRKSLASASNWLRGRLMEKLIGPDRRPWLGRLLLTWLRAYWHPDLLHVHGFGSSLMFVLRWAHEKKLPSLYQEHATPDPQFDLWKETRTSINMASRIIAVSDRSAQALREVCGVPGTILVSGPLLPDPFFPGWRKVIHRFESKLPFIVTTVARLHAAKGLGYLLEAAALVRREFPNIEFIVYGEGDLRAELIEKAASLGLEGDRIFRGVYSAREQLTRIMEDTDILLLSSVLEGQPVVIIEAMAHGCPIISTSVGGIPEVIQDGVNGLLCLPGDPQSLAEKIMWLAQHDEMRERLSCAARASYENGPFQPQAVCSTFSSIYREMVAEVCATRAPMDAVQA